MKTHDFAQGSSEWLAHRAQHFNASDAPAMMGCSPYMTRTELLRKKKTGLVAEVDASTQRRFDDGHRFEALARPLAEKIVGEDLYPVTGSEGELSASFDGLTLMEDVAFEHKTLNQELRECMEGLDEGPRLPVHYRVQMEQQLMVSGAERVLFMATRWEGDTLAEERHCWYASDPDLRAKIVAGWKQFAADLVNYAPTETVVTAVAEATETLPAVSVRMDGAIAVISNLELFGAKLREFVSKIDRNPSTDQAFANAEAAVKTLERAQAALEQAEAAALAQIDPVETMRRTVADYTELARSTRLMLEKVIKARKEQLRGEIVASGVSGLRDHIAALNARLGKPYMPTVPADFAGVIKGKRSIDSLSDAVDSELARAKIAASEIADRIEANLKHLRETAGAHTFLFADAASIVLKAPDDLQALVANRIGEHERAEEARREKERERIRAEEQARADREARERQAAADAQAQREAQAAIAAAATPAPAPVAAPAPGPVATRVSPALPTDSGARLTLGQINERLEVVSVNAEQLARLGFPATVNRSARTYLESDFPRMCAVIQRHLLTVAQGVAA